MDKVITYNFGEDFIARIAGFIETHFLNKDNDLSRLAIVFGGRRPALFLKKELARRIKQGYFPPNFFSIDDFLTFILTKNRNFRRISEMDMAYLIYNLAKKITPQMLHGREGFSQFLPWAKEIATFIDELDLENVQKESLENIQASAEIGYDVPDNINLLLQNIISIRNAYHNELMSRNRYSRGFVYLCASKVIGEVNLNEFDKILFCSLFYLHKTEEVILKELYERDKAILVFQKDRNSWTVLEESAKVFNCRIEPQGGRTSSFTLNISRGFDTHSQVGVVRQTLKRIKNPEKTVIVLPDANTLIPLLSELASFATDFNVSMGYPLKRSSVYSLFTSIFKAQATRKDNTYYTKDYLGVLLHPLIKNLRISSSQSITRILVHKIEEILSGMEDTPLARSLFVELDDVECLEKLYALVLNMLVNMDIEVNTDGLRKTLHEVHRIAFRMWESLTTFSQFTCVLEEFINGLLNKSLIEHYPLNLKVIERICSIKDELKIAEFKEQEFKKEEVFKIFTQRLETEVVSFSGSPLKGLQILGLFETRSLSFDNVIVMDVNESVLPKLRVYEPLIPRQIMVSLGLNRLEREEEIQRYHFMCLISSAKSVHLVYDDSPEKERSRFIEELVWQKQKEEERLDVFVQPKARFIVEVLPRKSRLKKNRNIVAYLKRDFKYSPTCIDTYLFCPLRFYYLYVLGLEEKEELFDEPGGKEIGYFLHRLLEETYKEFLDKTPVIDEKFRKKFLGKFEESFEKDLKKRIGSDAFMVKDIMEYRLKRFLEKETERQSDEKNKVKNILSLEDASIGKRIKLSDKSFMFECRVDRIDHLIDDSILIIDYKSGTNPKVPAKLNKLKMMDMERQSIKEAIHSFQLPLYYYFVRERYKGARLNAVLYSLRDMELTYFINKDDIESAGEIMDICEEALEFILDEILNPQIDFEANQTNEHYCQYCPFFYLCR